MSWTMLDYNYSRANYTIETTLFITDTCKWACNCRVTTIEDDIRQLVATWQTNVKSWWSPQSTRHTYYHATIYIYKVYCDKNIQIYWNIKRNTHACTYQTLGIAKSRWRGIPRKSQHYAVLFSKTSMREILCCEYKYASTLAPKIPLAWL